MNAFAIFMLLSTWALHDAPIADASMLKGAANKQAIANKRHLKSRSIGPGYRDCDVSESKDEVKFTCRATNAPESADESVDSEDGEPQAEDRGIVLQPAIEIRDKIKYTVETGKKGVEVEVEYEQEYEAVDGDAEGESTTEFKIVFDSIIEYAKNETVNATTLESQAYDWDMDEVVQIIELEKWAPLTTVMNDEEGVVSHFFAYTEDLMVSFNFTISRTDKSDKITANSMKIDLHITNFPWMRNDTFLALTSTVSSEMEVDVKHDDEATVLLSDDVQIPFASATDTIGFVPLGNYQWDSVAEVVETDGEMAFIVMGVEETIEVPEETESVAMEGTGAPTEAPTVSNEETGDMEELLETGEEVSTEKQFDGVITVDKSQTIRVVATSPIELGNATSEVIAYSFVGSAVHNATHVYWDPEAGIQYEEQAGYVIGENGEPMTSFKNSGAASFTSGIVGITALVLSQFLLAW